MFISRYSLLLSFAFIFFPLVKGRVPQNSNRRKFLEENYHGGRLEKLRQVFQKREKLHYQELCATDGMYSFVSENSTARSLCLEALGYPETTTATTTIHSTIVETSFISTSVRITSTAYETVSSTTTIQGSASSSPTTTESARLRRDDLTAQRALDALVELVAAETFTTSVTDFQPMLYSACDCVYDGPLSTFTSSQIEYTTSTKGGYDLVKTATTITTTEIVTETAGLGNKLVSSSDFGPITTNYSCPEANGTYHDVYMSSRHYVFLIFCDSKFTTEAYPLVINVEDSAECSASCAYVDSLMQDKTCKGFSWDGSTCKIYQEAELKDLALAPGQSSGLLWRVYSPKNETFENPNAGPDSTSSVLSSITNGVSLTTPEATMNIDGEVFSFSDCYTSATTLSNGISSTWSCSWSQSWWQEVVQTQEIVYQYTKVISSQESGSAEGGGTDGGAGGAENDASSSQVATGDFINSTSLSVTTVISSGMTAGETGGAGMSLFTSPTSAASSEVFNSTSETLLSTMLSGMVSGGTGGGGFQSFSPSTSNSTSIQVMTIADSGIWSGGTADFGVSSVPSNSSSWSGSGTDGNRFGIGHSTTNGTFLSTSNSSWWPSGTEGDRTGTENMPTPTSNSTWTRLGPEDNRSGTFSTTMPNPSENVTMLLANSSAPVYPTASSLSNVTDLTFSPSAMGGDRSGTFSPTPITNSSLALNTLTPESMYPNSTCSMSPVTITSIFTSTSVSCITETTTVTPSDMCPCPTLAPLYPLATLTEDTILEAEDLTVSEATVTQATGSIWTHESHSESSAGPINTTSTASAEGREAQFPAFPRNPASKASTEEIEQSCRSVGNALWNGDFEGFHEPSGIEEPIGWNSTPPTGSGAGIQLTSHYAPNQHTIGGYRLGMVTSNSANLRITIWQAVTLCPGRTYQFEAWTRQIDSLDGCLIKFLINEQELGNVMATTIWGNDMKNRQNYTVGEENESASVTFLIVVECKGRPESSEERTLVIDDLSLTPVLEAV